MTLDDFFFYMPGYASIPLLLSGALAVWLLWRIFSQRRRQKKKTESVENSRTPVVK